MLLHVLSDSGEINNSLYSMRLQKRLVPNSGKLKDLRRLESPLSTQSISFRKNAQICTYPALTMTSLLTFTIKMLPSCSNSTPDALNSVRELDESLVIRWTKALHKTLRLTLFLFGR